MFFLVFSMSISGTTASVFTYIKNLGAVFNYSLPYIQSVRFFLGLISQKYIPVLCGSPSPWPPLVPMPPLPASWLQLCSIPGSLSWPADLLCCSQQDLFLFLFFSPSNMTSLLRPRGLYICCSFRLEHSWLFIVSV